MYSLLTQTFADQEAKIASLILEVTQVEKIFLLGSTLSQRRTESVFITDAPSCRYVSHYFILVVINNNKESNNTIQDKIENTCRSFIPVTAIVLSIKQFNEWLQEGHSFACRVNKFAVVLHDAGTTVPEESKDFDEVGHVKINTCIYTNGLNKVQEFLAGADLYRIREQNKMAAFMLHQAAEHVLHTLLRISTGLYVNTHNLDKLIRYCTMISYNLPDVFNRNNQKNERLFQLLQKAYIDARYKEDYTIKTDDLLFITERIRTFIEILKNTYERLGGLKGGG